MAKAIVDGREARESWKQTYHVLEIMQSFEKSSNAGALIKLESKYTRGEPMKNNPIHGILD